MVNVTVINIRSVFRFFCIAIALLFVFGIIKFVGENIKIVENGVNVSFIGCINNTLPKIKTTRENTDR